MNPPGNAMNRNIDKCVSELLRQAGRMIDILTGNQNINTPNTTIMHPLEAQLKKEKPALVLFTASDNHAGRQMNNIMHEAEQQLGNRVALVTIDIMKDQQLAGSYNIQTVPTVALFHHGRLVWMKSGILPVHEILEGLSMHIT